MKKFLRNSILPSIVLFFLIGCNNPFVSKDYELIEKNDKIYIFNKKNGHIGIIKDNYVYNFKNKDISINHTNRIITKSSALKYTKIIIRSKIYKDFVLYDMKLLLSSDNNNSITYKEWRDEIVGKNYNRITLRFLDKDGFKIVSEPIYLNGFTVNLQEQGLGYEGEIKLTNNLSSKINRLDFYYVFPSFDIVAK